MAEPSYYPLSPLRYPLEGTASPTPNQPLKGDVDLVHPADLARLSDPLGSRSSMVLAPLRRQPFHKNPSAAQTTLWRTIRTPLKIALLPLAAIGFLAFCYTVHRRPVPVNTYGLYAVTTQHLATIKGGITAISIIIISIALYPVYDLISSLQSEEFFRVLKSRSHGVPLEAVNHISTPSFGRLNTLMAMWNNSCSYYYLVGIVASLLIWVVGTLAPGSLTVDSVLADGELMAFAIGAVLPQSVYNATNVFAITYKADANANTAASITWAELELGVRYSFGMENSSEPAYAAFIAPPPLDLSTSTSARWLSDVIGLNPRCSWASTNITTPLSIPTNTTSIQAIATAYLPAFNLDVQVFGDDLSLDPYFAKIKLYSNDVKNHTTQAMPVDGSTVILMGQCNGLGCPSPVTDIKIDFTGVGDTFTMGSGNKTWTLAILACIPNITIETREVRSDGQGLLAVQPLHSGRRLSRQGNLNIIQTNALFSVVTSQLSISGATSSSQNNFVGLGSQVQAEFLFGKEQIEGLANLDTFGASTTISPAPIKNITEGYTQIIQSATKPYLGSYLGTAYVPGRIATTEIVFAASIPNLAVSTAVLALLAALIVIVHFRSGKGAEFTLVNVAAAMHGSELPAQFAQLEQLDASGEMDAEDAVGKGGAPLSEGLPEGQQHVVDAFADRRIVMQRRTDGSPVLHMS